MTTTVVHLIGSLDRGGAETVALDLCRRISPSETRQVFVCLSGRAGSLAEAFESAGAVVEPAPITSPFRAAAVMRTAIRRHRPHAVVSHVSLASGWMLAVAWVMRVPVRIARIHSEGDGRGDGPARRAYRVAARSMTVVFSSRIVAVSRSSLRFAVGRWAPMLAPSRAIIVGNGVDTDRFRPPRGASPSTVARVIHVGRAAPEKNRGVLVPIFTALDRTVRTRWRVVGPGTTADLGPLPTERFEVLGDRADVAELLRSSDVLVLPSIREGLPGVILEALATGLPVVASDLATLRDLAAQLPGITLVATDAPPEDWAAAIFRAFSAKPVDSAAIRAALLESEFTLERSVRDWRELFTNG